MKKVGIYTVQQKNGQVEILIGPRYIFNYVLLFGLTAFIAGMRLHLGKKSGYDFLHNNVAWLIPLTIFSVITLSALTYATIRKTTIRVQHNSITIKKATNKKEIPKQYTTAMAKPSFSFDKSYYNVYLTHNKKKVKLIEHTNRKKAEAIANYINEILFV